jgi:ABC-2 type transport system permease protein
VTNVEIGAVAGRSPDDETAAFIMTMLLFMTIATYGAMVLNGVVEEKASRVVEVLLARIPARSLLAGKVAGIGLLGLGQVAVTALAALIAAATFNDIDLPAARGPVLAWALVFFVLGYALYATVFGALGSLASRPEDAQSAVGPVSVLLILVYFVSFAAIGSPDASWARIVSWIPLTAPIAMPSRLAMGSAAWWEPAAACALTVGAIAALVVVGGRVYANAVLHNGPTLKLRDAWQHTTTVEQPILTRSPVDRHRVAIGALIAAVIAGGLVVATSGDAIIGIAAGSVVFALVDRVAGAWGGERRSSHTPTRWRGAHRGRQVEP